MKAMKNHRACRVNEGELGFFIKDLANCGYFVKPEIGR